MASLFSSQRTKRGGNQQSHVCHLSTTHVTMRLKRSTLYLGRAALIQSCMNLPPQIALQQDGQRPRGSLHELAAPEMHSQCVTTPLVGSYPAFSPLLHPRRQVQDVKSFAHLQHGAVVFFCITQPLRTASILGSGMPCAARTFLSQFHKETDSDRPSGCFSTAKVRKNSSTPSFFFFRQYRIYFLLTYHPHSRRVLL